MNCKRCGRTNRDEWRRCVNCGYELRPPELQQKRKVCRSCHSESPPHSRFCAECGVELTMESPISHQKICSSCGTANRYESRFCARCGRYLGQLHPDRLQIQDHSESRKPPKKSHESGHKADRRKGDNRPPGERTLRWPPVVVTLGLLGVGIVLVLAIQGVTTREPSKPPQLVEARSDDPVLETKVKDIASKFICSCGKCGEQSLDFCTCNTAVEERQLIRNYLQLGQTPDQVSAAVNNTFGWMKPEFASQSGSDSKAPASLKKLNDRDKLSRPLKEMAVGSLASITRVATSADRTEILSRFRCPCGQCGVEELKDCNCSHPRGAKEVKSFVDGKIREANLSVAQLVDLVEQQYGSRIR